MGQVQVRTHLLHAADGTPLSVTDYLLDRAQARASIVLMHGIGEHSGRYRHVARFFNDCGLSVRCYDHRGHGKSGGTRGDVVRGDPMVQDGQIVVEDFGAQFDAPPLLFGHSMGGLFAASLALSNRVALSGLILSSPALAIRLSRVERSLLAVMQRVAPAFGVPNGLSPQYLSHDAAVVTAYQADRLVHNKVSARLLRSMLDMIAFCQAHAGDLALPTLMVVAGDDHLVDAAGSRQFFANAPAGMATLHVYDQFYHEVFNEPQAKRAFDDVHAWLNAQQLIPA